MPVYGSILYWVQSGFQDQFGPVVGPLLLTFLLMGAQLAFVAGVLWFGAWAEAHLERRQRRIHDAGRLAAVRSARICVIVP